MRLVWAAVWVMSLTAGGAPRAWGIEPLLFAPGGPQVRDIHQGRLADCYLLSSLGAVALTRPELLLQGIKTSLGGARVRLFLEEPDGSFTPTWVPIDLHLGAEHALLSTDLRGRPIQWVAAYEKAFAKWLERHHKDVQNNELTSGDGYRAIGDGGRPSFILEALTGEPAADVAVRLLGGDELRQILARPQGAHPSPVLASTLAHGPLGEVRPWHCYLVLGMTQDGNGVLLRDPAHRSGSVIDQHDPQLQIVTVDNFRRWFANMTMLRATGVEDMVPAHARVINLH